MNPYMSTITSAGIKVDEYVLEKEIGKGSFGSVYRAQSTKTGGVFAIKRLSKSKYAKNPLLKKLLSSEVSIMSKINHPNILHLHRYFETESNYYLVLDFCNRGDLESVVKALPGERVDEATAVGYLKQIMNGFQELRKHKVLHRDFKLANLFLSDDRVVIGDFGFAKSGQEVAETRLGTPLTMAPEVLMTSSSAVYNSKADLWSVGVVFYELLFGRSPFFALTEEEIGRKIKQLSVSGVPFPLPISEESKDLIRRLLQVDPQRRIDWPDFFNHPLFSRFAHTSPEIRPSNNYGQLVLNNPNRFDQEFAQNRLQPTRVQQFTALDDYLNGPDLQPTPTQEQTFDPSNSEFLLAEIEYRYNHEKNKILFMSFACKKLHEASRSPALAPAREPLYNAHLLVLKKCCKLNYYMLVNIINGKNTFDLNETVFRHLANSPQFTKIYSIFFNDNDSLQAALNNSLASAPVRVNYASLIQNEATRLDAIDNALKECFNALKGFVYVIPREELNNYYRLLLYVLSSIHSETSFPYKTRDAKFQWEKFYAELPRLSSEEIQRMIN